MFRRVAYAALAVSLFASGAMVGACTPITTYSGFQAVDANPTDVKVGEDTKSTVMAKLGSPSATSTFDPNTWFYVSETSDRIAFYKPRTTKRDVTQVVFNKDDEKVTAVNAYTLKDGKVIAYNDRETPTRGRELSILEQLLGNAGRGSMLPQEEVAPGQRPGGQ
jgi:outer membrane protein assembly factor BamE (lipoprotein component of BamABCDE complex)